MSRRRPLARPLLLVVASLAAAGGLVLESGQRIAPLRRSPTESLLVDGPSTVGDGPSPSVGLLDLPKVEAWATSIALPERHLKTLYRVLLRPNNNEHSISGGGLFERLLSNDFPKKAAASLLLHNDLCKFAESTSTVVEASKSQRGYKLAIQFDREGGPVVETVLIRHAEDATTKTIDDEERSDELQPTKRKRRKPQPQHYTVCVSCQVGCARACTFCETGTMGLLGNLSSGQILEQVWHAERYLRQQSPDGAAVAGKVRNIVFMGMGEALDAYDSVHEACRGLTHQCLFGLKAKQITISTVGASPRMIKRLADDVPGVSLALSLHGGTQKLREELIPSGRGVKGSHLDELADALDYHAKRTGRGVMIEYLLIQDVNDGAEAADALGEFCIERQQKQRTNASGRGGRHASVTYVNLIPYNPTSAGDRFGYQTPSNERIAAFSSRLRERYGVRTLVRWSSADGRDATGACGQLAVASQRRTDETS
ncbi:hypothetical protein ACHAXT_010927 [Thalassiosira profunda]